MIKIQKVAVLGSGIMGSGIAAHLANCGIPSLMLDMVPSEAAAIGKENTAARNALVAKNKAALLKAKPSPLFRKSNTDLIEIGNFEDDFEKIAECDWIIEAVKEDLAVKQSILQKVDRYRSPQSVVSTNTSGVPLRQICEKSSPELRQHFLGTHFFNPPRYMKLVELIPGPETSPEMLATMSVFLENVLGKGVVFAKDTPNFIANRILTFYCQYIITIFSNYGLTVEDVDALTGPLIGHASSATFRTLDLVGIDTFVSVMGNVYQNCLNDERRELFVPTSWMKQMLDQKLLGEKTGAGFYRKSGERDAQGKSIILSLDINTMNYVPQSKKDFPCVTKAKEAKTLEERFQALYFGDDEGSRFLWDVFSRTADYAGRRIPEIADDIVNMDNAVKWGFSWSHGLFETWDILGIRRVCERMEKDGIEPPPIAKEVLSSGSDSFYKIEKTKTLFFDIRQKTYAQVPQNPKIIQLALQKRADKIVKENPSCSLIDLGDRILCAEFHSKMNTVDKDVLALLKEATDWINEEKYDGLVIANQGDHFSAGANLNWILGEILEKNWKKLEQAVQEFQNTNMALRFCRGPVVAAPHHYTFGGGIEITQHAARAVYAAETYGGLVEVGVGVIPGAGGTKEMLRRALLFAPDTVPDVDPFPYVRRAFETIAMAKVSTSGVELIDLGYLTENDVLCLNFDQQVYKAKQVCLGMVVAEYVPPRPAALRVLGESAAAAFRSAVYQFRLGGYASEHDALIAEHLARVLTGGDRAEGSLMSEQDVLDLEREAFCSLCGTEKTVARIQHMLKTGKPLRN